MPLKELLQADPCKAYGPLHTLTFEKQKDWTLCSFIIMSNLFKSIFYVAMVQTVDHVFYLTTIIGCLVKSAIATNYVASEANYC